MKKQLKLHRSEALVIAYLLQKDLDDANRNNLGLAPEKELLMQKVERFLVGNRCYEEHAKCMLEFYDSVNDSVQRGQGMEPEDDKCGCCDECCGGCQTDNAELDVEQLHLSPFDITFGAIAINAGACEEQEELELQFCRSTTTNDVSLITSDGEFIVDVVKIAILAREMPELELAVQDTDENWHTFDITDKTSIDSLRKRCDKNHVLYAAYTRKDTN